MIKKRIKRKYYIIVNILLILFLTYITFKTYTTYSSSKINLLSKNFFEREIYNALNSTVYQTMSQNDVEDILEIYKNAAGEILYVDYNLNNSYQILNEVTAIIKKELNDELSLENGLDYKVPFLVASNSVFLSNLGPKIHIKVNYVNSILTNLYTKITNYGLNNALVEAYIKITIEGRVVTPINDKNQHVTYDLLVSSKIINGRIPEFYGNYLTTNSSIFDVPIN